MDTHFPANDDPAKAFYVSSLARLHAAGIPCLVGGGFAFSQYSGIHRSTKDLDIFLRPSDVRQALTVFERAGFRTDLPFPHWLAKVHGDDCFIDLIFSSGNGIASVDDLWFEYARPHDVLGLPVRLCPPEEMIWSKAFIQERERFDGADVLHLIQVLGPTIDWKRLLVRFDEHWLVLLGHLVLFRFVYPSRAAAVPAWVVEELTRRYVELPASSSLNVCRGTLLSREQYLYDIERLGFEDARLAPHGPMTRDEAEIWTAAIDRK